MNQLFLILTACAYALSFGLYVFFLKAGKVLAGRLGTLLLAVGLILHYFALLERSGPHKVPYHDLYGSMSLFGWLLALTYLGLELYHRQRSVGALVLPFILVFFLAAHLAPGDKLSPPDAQGASFAFHVALSILAYAAFALSFVLSLIFLVEDRLLRRHKLGDRHRHGPRVLVGGSRQVFVLRPEVRDHACGSDSIRRVFPAFASRFLARRSRIEAVHFQFPGRVLEFYGCEFVPLP